MHSSSPLLWRGVGGEVNSRLITTTALQILPTFKQYKEYKVGKFRVINAI